MDLNKEELVKEIRGVFLWGSIFISISLCELTFVNQKFIHKNTLNFHLRKLINKKINHVKINLRKS